MFITSTHVVRNKQFTVKIDLKIIVPTIYILFSIIRQLKGTVQDCTVYIRIIICEGNIRYGIRDSTTTTFCGVYCRTLPYLYTFTTPPVSLFVSIPSQWEAISNLLFKGVHPLRTSSCKPREEVQQRHPRLSSSD